MPPQEDDFETAMDKMLGGNTPAKEEKPNEPDKEEQKKTEKKEPDFSGEGDDDEPIFSKEGKQTEKKEDKKEEKKTKEDSMADLRKARDAARERAKIVDDLFGEADAKAYKPLIDIINERVGGPITEDAIKQVIEDYKNKDKEIEDLRAELAENGKRIQDLDIRHSKDFQKKYVEPYQEADKSLFVEFANLNDKGEIIGAESTKSLHEYLVGNIDGLDQVKVKARLLQFAKDYEKETGEKPELPTLASMMSSIRHFRERRDDMKNAYDNWKDLKQKTQTERQAEEEKNRELANRQTKRERSNLATKAYREFNHGDYEGIIDDSEISKLFTEEFKRGESIFDGKEIPSYDVMLKRGVKAELFDKIFDEYKELKKLKEELDMKERSGIPGHSPRKAESQGKQEGWAAI